MLKLIRLLGIAVSVGILVALYLIVAVGTYEALQAGCVEFNYIECEQ